MEAQKSKLLFFNGDMIMGLGLAGPTPSNSVADVVGSDLMAFYRQHGFWRGMVAPLMEAGTYVVPVAGNHDVQSKSLGKNAQVENENAWRANMGDLIIDCARFKSIVGTDATNVNVVATGGGLKHFFVFWHKPAYTYYFGTNTPPNPGVSGLDKVPASRDAFWSVIEQYGATYFCGHNHEFNMAQPRGAAWQVLVGAGGSPFDATPGEVTLNPATDRTYAWATVKVHRSGKVDINAYGFSDSYGPTRLLKHATLAR